MPHRIRSHVRANLVGYLALFVALGGGAYAATLAPDNSVDSSAIINSQVKAADVASKAITHSKLAPRALTIVTDHDSFTVGHGSVNSGDIPCPNGSHILSGGYVITTSTLAIPLSAYPSHSPPEGYHVTVLVPPTEAGIPTSDAEVDIVAYCAKGQLELDKATK